MFLAGLATNVTLQKHAAILPAIIDSEKSLGQYTRPLTAFCRVTCPKSGKQKLQNPQFRKKLRKMGQGPRVFSKLAAFVNSPTWLSQMLKPQLYYQPKRS